MKTSATKLVLCLTATTLASCRLGYEDVEHPTTYGSAQAGSSGRAVVVGGAGSNGGLGQTLQGGNGGVATAGDAGTRPGGTSMGGAATSTDAGGTLTVGGATGSLMGGSGGSSSGGIGPTGAMPSTGGTSSVGSSATAGTANNAGSSGSSGTGGNPGLEFDPASKSCEGLTTLCQNQSCCISIAMPSGSFRMGRSTEPTASDYYDGASSNELPEHDATVAAFALDKYEVTVARFRSFVAVYDQWHTIDGNPASGNGANPNASNTGWDVAWNTADSSLLPVDAATLTANLSCGNGNWTLTANKNEMSAVNCVNWYEAFAFCVWDAGRLPTEAEWEYAAAGGVRNQLYPWGSDVPDASRANYEPLGTADLAVGSIGLAGAGHFGHLDLCGSMWEWALDWYLDTYYSTVTDPVGCVNCANTVNPSVNGGYRVSRGSAWDTTDYGLRSAYRGYFWAPSRGGGMGFRCARAAP